MSLARPASRVVARLRAVIRAKDEQIASLTASLETAVARLNAAAEERRASRERERERELRVAELERRLSMDSTDPGTPSSKERIGAKQAREARQQSERDRRKDRKRGGRPGHQGKGPERDPDPGETKTAGPPAGCRSCRASLDGAEAAEPRWAQVIDVQILRMVTEYLLPGLCCACCGAVTFAEPPPGLHAGAVCYGPVLNAAAVLLSCHGNVPAGRSARLIGMLLGTDVSPGWAGKAVARVNTQLTKAGFDDAMIAAPAAERSAGRGPARSSGRTRRGGRTRPMRRRSAVRPTSIPARPGRRWRGCCPALKMSPAPRG